jgi:hypothetical protein
MPTGRDVCFGVVAEIPAIMKGALAGRIAPVQTLAVRGHFRWNQADPVLVLPASGGRTDSIK